MKREWYGGNFEIIIIMKLYIVTIVDVNGYGFNPSSVKVFTSEKEAKKFIWDEYSEKCVKARLSPFAENDITHQISDSVDYAYIADTYYWDLFEKELAIEVSVK